MFGSILQINSFRKPSTGNWAGDFEVTGKVYFKHRRHPNRAQAAFWLMELRTPEFLIEAARRYQRTCRRLTAARPLLVHALSSDLVELVQELAQEEAAERAKDRRYWSPLHKQLEALRHSRRPNRSLTTDTN
jgi:hypothetical protein